MKKLELEVKKRDKLLNLLSTNGFSYNYACKILRNKDVKINGCRVKDNIDVMEGDSIIVFYADDALKQNFSIVFEDENILCINKGKGIEVEGEDGLEGKIKGAMAVHRLDRNTEGLLVMAKNKFAKEELLLAFKNHSIIKKYIAEVVGNTSFSGEMFTAYLEKDSKNSLVKIYKTPKNNRQEIKTTFKTLKSSGGTSLVECILHTGKTHQIRAHLAFLGYPIIGDGKYGKNEINKKYKAKSQNLQCCYIKLEGLGAHLDYLNGKEFFLETKYIK